MMWWVVLGLLSFVAPLRAADAEPRLRVERPVYDFGEVEQGTRVEHLFRLGNAGAAPLRVEHVKSTCACTVGAVVGRDVPPGGETVINVQLDTAELAGPTTKTITVYTNDPAHPAVGLSLRGTVLADLVVDPPLVYLGRTAAGRAAPRTVRIRPGRPGVSARATVVEAPPFVRARLASGTNGTDQALEVELAPDAPPGRVSGEIVVETTSARQPRIVVPVFGTVTGPRESS